jgi:thiamine-monophosphate kinase
MNSEFDFIDHIKSKYDLSKIGDDCAVIPKDKKHDFVITTDLLVEDIDFRRSWMIPKFLGHKSLAVSLSDIAAMGGKPKFAMLSVGIPEDIWKTNFLEEFYSGWHKLAKKFKVELIGGDVSKTPDKIVIDSIVFGEVTRNKAVMRSTANVGDQIFVTGKLGGAALGLKYLEEKTEGFDSLKKLQLKPNPRIYEGQFLSKIATSMIDISDGLSSDLLHICRASEVGAKLFFDKIPTYLNEFPQNLSSKIQTSNYIFDGGEDFELLFTVNSKNILDKKLTNFHHIGELTQNTGNIELIRDSKSTVLLPKGYQHF